MNPSKTKRQMMLRMVGIAMLSALATASQAQPPAPQSASPTTPSGTLSGRVASSAGEPISSATVYVSTLGIAAPARTAKVDANGAFKIDGLEIGVYSVSAREPGFVPSPPSFIPTEGRRYYRTGVSVSLTLIKGGVITGSVTTATNAPVVGAAVRVVRIKDENGQPIPGFMQTGERFTDDRGIYRTFGLSPGVYIVSAGGPPRFFSGFTSPYEADAPTYAPSATSDTASEIVVRSGEEAIVDIQYRGEPGHAVSGTIAGLSESQTSMATSATVTLTELRTRALVMSSPSGTYNNYSFAFYGVPDGEYELTGSQYPANRDIRSSEPRRLRVQGADITGISLSLAPLASITGQLVVERDPKINCVKRRATASQETVIVARRFIREAKPDATQKEKTQQDGGLTAFPNLTSESVADARGDFILRNLRRGSYRIDLVLPDAGWYLRSLAIGSGTAAKTSSSNIALDGVSLKSGERVSGLILTLTEGAAGLRGRVSVAEGQSLPSGLRAYLAPAERESRDDVLRFFEARTDGDGRFAVDNIAPGRYWIIARPDDESDPAKVKSIRQDSVLRAKVLRRAEDLKKEISLKPCERSSDFDLPYLPSPPPGQ
jgi:hypothetical protein